METFAMYLIRSVIWLAGFAIVYFLFLRNERFFRLKRFYLLAGILAALFLPLITFHYRVVVPLPAADSISGFLDSGDPTEEVMNAVQAEKSSGPVALIWIVYLAGILLFTMKAIMNALKLVRIVNNAKPSSGLNARVIRSEKVGGSFSFLRYIFINPSVREREMDLIMDHEMVHVSQKHWFDLLLAELLRIIQWFNPLAWIYPVFIRQNHEYIADETVLKRIPDPGVYKAVLINQMMDAKVFSLANSFSYSLNRLRFEMMKKSDVSPLRKMRLLIVLPVFAIIFYAFRSPEYHYPEAPSPVMETVSSVSMIQKQAGGLVVDEEGNPVQGVRVLVSKSTIFTTTDSKGRFSLSNLPDGSSLIFSCPGYKTYIMLPLLTSNKGIRVRMVKDPEFKKVPVMTSEGSEVNALVAVNGILRSDGLQKVEPDAISSINLLRDDQAAGKYGMRGREGVLEITTVKPQEIPEPAVQAPPPDLPEKQKAEKILSDSIPVRSRIPEGPDMQEPFVVVEEMPMFPGGEKALLDFLQENLVYPEKAKADSIQGKVIVRFVVNTKGEAESVDVIKGVHHLLDAEAIRVVDLMNGFKPGKQGGQPVNVWYMVPVNFELK